MVFNNKTIDYKKIELKLNKKRDYGFFFIFFAIVGFLIIVAFIIHFFGEHIFQILVHTFYVLLILIYFISLYFGKINTSTTKYKTKFDEGYHDYSISKMKKMLKYVLFKKDTLKELFYMYFKIGYLEDAKSIYYKMRINKKDIQLQFDMSIIYIECLQYNEAIDILESIHSRIKSAYVLFYLAFSYYEKLDYIKAEELFFECLSNDESFYSSYFYIGNIYRFNTNDSQAVFYYKQFLFFEDEIEDKELLKEIKEYIGEVEKISL